MAKSDNWICKYLMSIQLLDCLKSIKQQINKNAVVKITNKSFQLFSNCQLEWLFSCEPINNAEFFLIFELSLSINRFPTTFLLCFDRSIRFLFSFSVSTRMKTNKLNSNWHWQHDKLKWFKKLRAICVFGIKRMENNICWIISHNKNNEKFSKILFGLIWIKRKSTIIYAWIRHKLSR